METKFYWDSDILEDLKGESGAEMFRHVYIDCDWSDEVELINIFSDLVKAVGGFEYEGVTITDPTYDETGRYLVNGIEYYKLKEGWK